MADPHVTAEHFDEVVRGLLALPESVG